jgi:protoheme IX farnesyltransferase
MYSMLLVPVSLIPHQLGMSGNLYVTGALLLGLTYFYFGMRIARERTLVRARQVLMASIVYLPLLYSLMLVDSNRL